MLEASKKPPLYPVLDCVLYTSPDRTTLCKHLFMTEWGQEPKRNIEILTKSTSTK